MEDDPWAEEDLPAAREIVAAVEGAELFVYPGDRHLFADSSVSDYEPDSAALLKRRALSFLERVE
jgi:dienelactone hydrolase